MTTRAIPVASGAGWSVRDVLCTAGPHDRPFEERHEGVCIAAVMEGSFQYRSSQGRAMLAPGSILLGSPGQCFECGHEHAAGDRCLAFHFEPDCFEAILSDLPATRGIKFAAASLPALPAFIPLLAASEAAREAGDGDELEELSLRLCAAVMGALTGDEGNSRSPSRRDEARVTDALRLIETEADGFGEGILSLSSLASAVSMSPYHFLRCFREVVGMTPHQYVLRTRLHRAAVRLRDTRDPVSAIAFESGFNDLSTFNHRFRRVMGVTPGEWRSGRDAVPAGQV